MIRSRAPTIRHRIALKCHLCQHQAHPPNLYQNIISSHLSSCVPLSNIWTPLPLCNCLLLQLPLTQISNPFFNRQHHHHRSNNNNPKSPNLNLHSVDSLHLQTRNIISTLPMHQAMVVQLLLQAHIIIIMALNSNRSSKRQPPLPLPLLHV